MEQNYNFKLDIDKLTYNQLITVSNRVGHVENIKLIFADFPFNA